MASVLDSVPVDRINAEAREIDLGRTILTVLAAALWLIGWVAGKTAGFVFGAVAWSLAAVRVGWRDARGRRPDGGG